jgi:dTDP-4-dehydrorhamnose reductase
MPEGVMGECPDWAAPGLRQRFGKQLGRELAESLQSSAVQASLGHVGQDLQVTSWSRADFDFADLDPLNSRLEALSPHIILNASAYTAVDLAEDHEHEAFQINAELPQRLAQFAAQTRAVLVHYSTDFVFDGEKQTPYTEEDTPRPLSAYGRSKLAGEAAIECSGCQHLIFRTGWLMGARGQNFLTTMLRLGSERDALRVVADQWGAPTPASWLARMSLKSLALGLKHSHDARAPHGAQAPKAWASSTAPWGLYHASSLGQTSWHGYAQYALQKAQELGFALKVKPDSIEGIGTQDYPVKARRPAYSVLSTEKLQRQWAATPPDWQDAVSDVLKELQSLRQALERQAPPSGP